LGNTIPVGVKPKRGQYVFWLFFKIGPCSAISFKSSRRGLFIEVAEHRSMLKNDQNAHYPRFSLTTEVLFLLCIVLVLISVFNPYRSAEYDLLWIPFFQRKPFYLGLSDEIGLQKLLSYKKFSRCFSFISTQRNFRSILWTYRLIWPPIQLNNVPGNPDRVSRLRKSFEVIRSTQWPCKVCIQTSNDLN